ncbi:MAG: TonB family protein [Chitinophagaceae bacterium]
MEAGTILTADVLDIIFDDRNKAYGAYDLRKHYQRRLIKSLITMFLIVVLIMVTYLLVAAIKPATTAQIVVAEITLDNIADKKKPEEQVVIPPPVKQGLAPIKTKMFTKFLVTPDDKVPDDEKPPEQTDLDNTKIGLANVEGKEDDNLMAPPVNEKTGVVDAPKKQDDAETIFTKVEIESQYPGGTSAWAAFLNRKLNYPQDAVDNNVQGTVVIQFIVDLQGNVSDVTAISGPQELRAAAVAVIKQSSKWTAAIQNGKPVKSYKKQPIVFRLPE